VREISVNAVQSAVAALCREANVTLSPAMIDAIQAAKAAEVSPLAANIFSTMLENLTYAKDNALPICQDTGMAVVFLEIGQDVHFIDGSLTDAVNGGVAQGYTEGHLRFSVVSDPLSRINTGDNTPAVLHTEIVSGDKVKITVAPKGFGSENMSKLKMFPPSATRDSIIDFVLETVQAAGGNPCPPVVVGVGIGGTMEKCALLAKQALVKDTPPADAFYATLAEELLLRINALGIGPQGLGGNTTALSVNILTYPTHIAGLPVAVNMGCHVNRHASVIL